MGEVSGSPQWLVMRSPAIWNVTDLLAFWCGSGAFALRCIMRAGDSTGRQQIAPDAPTELRTRCGSGPDRTVWTFSAAWVLVDAAVLGPDPTVPFALADTRKRGRRGLRL